MRLDRLLSIVFLLLNRDKIASAELAKKFNVSTRTIFRDIKTINEAGIPVISYGGADGGFSIIEDYRIDKQVLTIKEMYAIVHALKGVNASLQNSEIDKIIDKICDLMPRKFTIEEQSREMAVAIDLIPWGMSGKYQENIRKINHAIENCLVIKFRYNKIDAAGEERQVEPMTILFKGYTWYLFGFCRLRKDFRIFRISRMKDLAISGIIFQRKTKNYQDCVNWEETGQKIALKLKFSKVIKTAVEDNFSEDNIIYDEAGNLIVTTTMPESGWVYGFILSFGSFVEVLEPLHYREFIKNEGEKIFRLYQEKSGFI
ncbi:MAG: YafY family transcriptional regulator [Candidatus Marinimicrobia bacterium]|nr:YafY family transcriptional regulator [Candidatus Neomarinimicrobiota bacterium]